MKYYKWQEPDFNHQGEYVGPKTYIWSEEQILEDYWDHWKRLMDKKWGEGYELTTKEECVKDFVVVHWAWEVNNE